MDSIWDISTIPYGLLDHLDRLLDLQCYVKLRKEMDNEEFKGKVALDTGAEFWNPLDDTSQALQLENPAGI